MVVFGIHTWGLLGYLQSPATNLTSSPPIHAPARTYRTVTLLLQPFVVCPTMFARPLRHSACCWFVTVTRSGTRTLHEADRTCPSAIPFEPTLDLLLEVFLVNFFWQVEPSLAELLLVLKIQTRSQPTRVSHVHLLWNQSLLNWYGVVPPSGGYPTVLLQPRAADCISLVIRTSVSFLPWLLRSLASCFWTNASTWSRVNRSTFFWPWTTIPFRL